MQQETTSTQQEKDAYFMGLALEQAKIAGEQDEVPIGAVVVYRDHVIAQGYNRREIDNDPAGHAEFIALKKASEHLGAWRLSGYQARIDRCVYGAADPKAGALGSLYSINADDRLNHIFEVTAGVRSEESANLLQTFFREKRQRNKERRKQAQEVETGYHKNEA